MPIDQPIRSNWLMCSAVVSASVSSAICWIDSVLRDGLFVVPTPRLSNTSTRWSRSIGAISSGSHSAIVAPRPITITSHGPCPPVR